MPTLYADTKQRYWILAPQVTKWRHRYRGQRESWKINLGMSQFLYDVRKLYEGTITIANKLSSDLYNIEFGSVDLSYDNSDIVLTGEQDFITRLTKLIKRIEQLERNNA